MEINLTSTEELVDALETKGEISMTDRVKELFRHMKKNNKSKMP